MWIPERVNQRGRVVPAFQIDECFVKEVKKHRWYEDKGYFCSDIKTEGKVRSVFLHRFVWGLSGRPVPSQIDHINGMPSDNRIDNLRPATYLSNAKNNRRRRPNKCGLPQGVKLQSNGGFESRLRHRKKLHNLGTYDTAEEASAVYQNAKEILIEFANLPGYENVLTGGIER